MYWLSVQVNFHHWRQQDPLLPQVQQFCNSTFHWKVKLRQDQNWIWNGVNCISLRNVQKTPNKFKMVKVQNLTERDRDVTTNIVFSTSSQMRPHHLRWHSRRHFTQRDFPLGDKSIFCNVKESKEELFSLFYLSEASWVLICSTCIPT